MPNTNAVSGKQYERDIIRYVNGAFPLLDAHRPAQRSFADRGDVRLSTAVVQAKHYPTGTRTIEKHLADVERQAAQHATSAPLTPIAVVSTTGTPATDLAVVRFRDIAALLHERDLLDIALGDYHCPDPRI